MSSTQKYIIGIGWFILSLVSSAINDIIAKYVGHSLGSMQVTFLRCFFSLVTLLPFIVIHGVSTIKTMHPFIQLLRGILLFFGMASWIYGLRIVPVSTATAISFSIPLFVLVFAFFFLEERIIWQRWVATIVGFLGMIITLHVYSSEFRFSSLIFLLATMAFALLDIINKKFVIKESMLCMLFYSALVTTLLSFPPALAEWTIPTATQLSLLFVLGGSANLILFFLLKAFSMVDATAVAPYRYFELAISATLAYVAFGETPHHDTLYGAAVLIPTTLFIAWSETKSNQKAHH